jgi:hypothetical protein
MAASYSDPVQDVALKTRQLLAASLGFLLAGSGLMLLWLPIGALISEWTGSWPDWNVYGLVATELAFPIFCMWVVQSRKRAGTYAILRLDFICSLPRRSLPILFVVALGMIISVLALFRQSLHPALYVIQVCSGGICGLAGLSALLWVCHRTRLWEIYLLVCAYCVTASALFFIAFVTMPYQHISLIKISAIVALSFVAISMMTAGCSLHIRWSRWVAGISRQESHG